MTNILLHKNLEKKKYPLYSVIQIPEYSNKPKYTKFKNFLENNSEDFCLWPACDNEDIGALEVDKENVFINTEKCIACLLCFSSNKTLEKSYEKVDKITNQIFPNFYEIKKIIEETDIFNGNIINLPRFGGNNRNIKSFSDFTSKKETTHISLWGCSILNFLSSDSQSRIGKEIEILKMDNPRDGRLDVCVLSGNKVIICESKVSLDSLLTENRYRLQLPSYKKECKRILDEFNLKFKTNKKLQIFLLTGGEETDLFPPTHSLCTSNVGNKSTRFYKELVEHEIKFISANALWIMMLRSLIKNRRLCWDILFDKIFDEKTLGLLTAGKVEFIKGRYEVTKIPKEILMSSEKDFSSLA